MSHDHPKQLQVLQCVFSCRLYCLAFNDHFPQLLHLERISILIGVADGCLLVCPILILCDVHCDWQAFDVWRVVLHSNRLGSAVDLEVCIESRNVINTGLV